MVCKRYRYILIIKSIIHSLYAHWCSHEWFRGLRAPSSEKKLNFMISGLKNSKFFRQFRKEGKISNNFSPAVPIGVTGAIYLKNYMEFTRNYYLNLRCE